jgi:hypothetical protein
MATIEVSQESVKRLLVNRRRDGKFERIGSTQDFGMGRQESTGLVGNEEGIVVIEECDGIRSRSHV